MFVSEIPHIYVPQREIEKEREFKAMDPSVYEAAKSGDVDFLRRIRDGELSIDPRVSENT